MDCSLPVSSESTWVGSNSLLQGIFPPQGSNPGLLHCRQILYHLSYQVRHLKLFFSHPEWLLRVLTDGKHRKIHSELLQTIPSRDKHMETEPKLPSFLCKKSSHCLQSHLHPWLGFRGFYVVAVFWVLFNMFLNSNKKWLVQRGLQCCKEKQVGCYVLKTGLGSRCQLLTTQPRAASSLCYFQTSLWRRKKKSMCSSFVKCLNSTQKKF